MSLTHLLYVHVHVLHHFRILHVLYICSYFWGLCYIQYLFFMSAAAFYCKPFSCAILYITTILGLVEQDTGKDELVFETCLFTEC